MCNEIGGWGRGEGMYKKELTKCSNRITETIVLNRTKVANTIAVSVLVFGRVRWGVGWGDL